MNKLKFAIFFALSGTFFSAANTYADGYLGQGEGTVANWQASWGAYNWQTSWGTSKSGIPSDFTELNQTYFNNALFMTFRNYNTSYVGLPGTAKSWDRAGIFKLQRSTNGEQNGPREDLVVGSKKEAQDLCNKLTVAAHGSTCLPANYSIFSSDYLGGIKKVIAVRYKVDYQGELTPATKFWFCPNPWNWGPGADFEDENESRGIRASGFVDSDDHYYKVACMDPSKPETTFWRIPAHRWTNGRGATYKAMDNSDLNETDYFVGRPYCHGFRSDF